MNESSDPTKSEFSDAETTELAFIDADPFDSDPPDAEASATESTASVLSGSESATTKRDKTKSSRRKAATTKPAKTKPAKTKPVKTHPRRDRSWVVLGLSIAFVVSVVAGFSYLMRDSLTPEPDKAFDLKFTDNFNRRGNTGGLGTTAQGQEWKSVRGLWNVDAGRAIAALPDKDLSLAVIGSLKNSSVQAFLSGKQTCGVVARYLDEKNFVALFRVPQYGVWNLVDVEGGKQTLLGKLPDVPGVRVLVKLETGQRVVNAYVGLNRVSVVSRTDRSVGAVGFVGYSNGAIDCVWEDLWAFSGR